MIINNWSIRGTSADPYLAPECRIRCLHGQVERHHELGNTDGKYVETSGIVSVDGLIVTTKSGSKYQLGTIRPEFVEHLNKRTPGWTKNNPLGKWVF